MKNINQKSINQFLKIFINLTDEEEKLIKERLSSVDLKPGQPLTISSPYQLEYILSWKVLFV